MASTLIIIVSYNSAPILARCLDTVRRQTLVPARIVVVDNDSEDAATLELLAQLTDVDVVRMDKNVGYGPAINAVALGSDGYDYLCCLNPDAFPASDWLAQLVGSLEADPKLGSAASLLISDKDEQVLDGAGDELSIGGYPWRAGHDRRHRADHEPRRHDLRPRRRRDHPAHRHRGPGLVPRPLHDQRRRPAPRPVP